MVLKIALIHLEYFHRITEKFRLQGGSLEVVLTSFLLQIGQLQRNSEDGGFHSRSIYISADLTPTTFAVDVGVGSCGGEASREVSVRRGQGCAVTWGRFHFSGGSL